MITNSVGILLYSFIYGKKIGEDKIGNKFFVHKKIKNKKWVLYKHNIDPTILDVKWQMWLTNKNENIDLLSDKNNFSWQKEKRLT